MVATFSYTGATVSGIDRLITVGAGGGTFQATSAAGATLTLTGGITMGGNALTIDTSGTTAANIIISTAAISGTSGAALTKTGSGNLTITVAGSNAAANTTTITGGKIMSGIANALPSTTTLSLGASGTFDMAGFAQSVASLTGTAH